MSIDPETYRRNLEKAARAARAEAEARRRAQAGKIQAHTSEKSPKEIGGPEGPEPTRYGDWERKGIVSDF